jgi:hypothetical protein
MKRVLPAVLALSLISACSSDSGTGDDEEVDCTKVTNADTFVVGLSKTGEAGMLGFALMSASPAPPARDDNTWIVQITDNGGHLLPDATLTVTPFMPSHQHGSPVHTDVTPTSTPGEYTLDPVNMWMPGVWEVTIQAKKDAVVDSAVYTFCIN